MGTAYEIKRKFYKAKGERRVGGVEEVLSGVQC